MVRFQIPTVLRGKKKKRVKHKGRFTIKTTIKIFDKKLDHSLFKIKNESIVFKTNTDNTLGKLHRISKIPLQRNGMADISKLKRKERKKEKRK